MKHIYLYNVIFPIWFLLFFPPVILMTLVGNFIIDSLVILACFFIFKLAEIPTNAKEFYRKSILKVWIFGFLSDLVGAAILFITGILGDYLGFSYELSSAINFDPFSHFGAVIVIIIAMLVSAFLIFLLNYKITFKELIRDRSLRLKTSLTLAIVTMPWTFLLPTKWFYRGF